MAGKGHYEPRRRARRRALQAVYQWQMTGQEPAEILRQFLEIQDMKGVDVEHFEKILRGVGSNSEELDAELQPFLDRSIGLLDEMERATLRIGAFELLHCPELPYRVVLDECVDLAHRFGSEQGHSFINAVLDKAVKKWREHETATP